MRTSSYGFEYHDYNSEETGNNQRYALEHRREEASHAEYGNGFLQFRFRYSSMAQRHSITYFVQIVVGAGATIMTLLVFAFAIA